MQYREPVILAVIGVRYDCDAAICGITGVTMYTDEQLDTVRDLISEGMPYNVIARTLEWRLSDGRPNVTRVWRAVQRIKRDKAGGKIVKAISPRDITTVGDAIKTVREILNAIPSRLYLESLDSTKTET